jgi:hypothetical protein
LFGKNIEEWKSTLDRHERIPNKEIQKILKISFNALEEKTNKVFFSTLLVASKGMIWERSKIFFVLIMVNA